MLSFLAAERLGAGLDERLDVIVNGKTLLAKHNPATFFKQVRVVFNADSSGTCYARTTHVCSSGRDTAQFFPRHQWRTHRLRSALHSHQEKGAHVRPLRSP